MKNIEKRVSRLIEWYEKQKKKLKKISEEQRKAGNDINPPEYIIQALGKSKDFEYEDLKFIVENSYSYQVTVRRYKLENPNFEQVKEYATEPFAKRAIKAQNIIEKAGPILKRIDRRVFGELIKIFGDEVNPDIITGFITGRNIEYDRERSRQETKNRTLKAIDRYVTSGELTYKSAESLKKIVSKRYN